MAISFSAGAGSEDPDVRRLSLAKRLVMHRARTQTIYELTGLTRHRLSRLRRRWNVPEDSRQRGPSPSSFSVFFRSTITWEEATSAALICRLSGVLTTRLSTPTSKYVGTLEVGERLCEAYEAFCACIPDHKLEFEHILLLARGLVRNEYVCLDSCIECRGAMLVDLYGTRDAVCGMCKSYVGIEKNSSKLHILESEIR